MEARVSKLLPSGGMVESSEVEGRSEDESRGRSGPPEAGPGTGVSRALSMEIGGKLLPEVETPT